MVTDPEQAGAATEAFGAGRVGGDMQDGFPEGAPHIETDRRGQTVRIHGEAIGLLRVRIGDGCGPSGRCSL
jgi:hypothetical protein